MDTPNLETFLPLLASVTAALVAQGVKWAAPRIPKVGLWFVSLVVGTAAAALGDATGLIDVSAAGIIGLGLAGTGVAEGAKQTSDVMTQNPDRLREPEPEGAMPLR